MKEQYITLYWKRNLFLIDLYHNIILEYLILVFKSD